MMLPTMPDIWVQFNTPAANLLGWALLHFVWQGALVAAVLAGALRLLRNHTPQVRYVVSCVALAGLLALPVGTGGFLAEHRLGDDPGSSSVVAEAGPADAHEAGPVSITAVPSSSPPSWQAQVFSWVRPALPWIVFGWAVGVLFFSVRLAGGAWRVRRLRRSGSPVPNEWQERVQALADQVGLHRSISLRQASSVDSPMAIGWWRPVVLVPAGLLAGLPPAQVEALLLHELAHIRRHDVLVGRLQAVVEVLLFFHPATWWISRQVRREREACCDDLTVQAGADRLVYARALTTLAEHGLVGVPAAWAPAANDGALLTRIRRLLSPMDSPSTGVQRLSMAAAVLLLVGVPVGLAACASQQSTTEAEPVPTEEEAGSVDPGDSTRSEMTIRSQNSVEGDSLSGVYVFRDGEQVDTLDLPHFDDEPVLDSLRVPVAPERLKKAILREVNPDSLEEVFRAQINSDSLRRVIRNRLNPDSLERAIRAQFDFEGFAQWHEQHADSLQRHARQHADRLRSRLDSLRDHRERQMPEHLREQARRLREQAERLEERAREMSKRREEELQGEADDSPQGT